MENVPWDALCDPGFVSEKSQALEGNREHVFPSKTAEKNMCYQFALLNAYLLCIIINRFFK